MMKFYNYKLINLKIKIKIIQYFYKIFKMKLINKIKKLSWICDFIN